MPKDFFPDQDSIAAPAGYAAAVTPADGVAFDRTRSLYVGVAGDLAVTMGGQTIVFKNAPVGYHPLQVTGVLATGTTAQSIVALR